LKEKWIEFQCSYTCDARPELKNPKLIISKT
jgi:hypothetical protein